MIRIRPALVAVLALCFVGVSAAAAQACTKTWIGGSGNWGEENHWSPKGVPSSEQDACITEPGTYTVELSAGGGSVKTLTVGASSGIQTVDVVGTSYIYGGETQHVTALRAGSASFASNTRLVLDATEGGSRSGSEEFGAGAYLVGGPIEERGQIETKVTGSKWDDRVKVGGLKLLPGASMDVASGMLRFIQEGEGGYPWATTNEGTFTVAAGAAVEMQPSFAGSAAFTNLGSVVNSGSITGTGTDWAQLGGSVSGNEVLLLNGSTLTDVAGPGAFLDNHGTITVTGTIPAGQTVTVRGEPYGYGGETYYSTTLAGGGKELVNDGTLVLNPTGSGEVSGGVVNVEAGSIRNNSVIVDETETASRHVQLLDSLSNGPGAKLEVRGGIFEQNEGAAVTNEGLITIAPGSLYRLQEAAVLTNAASGTLAPQIASATSFGAIQLTSPCCHGPGELKAGGTLAPTLVGGFVPFAGEEFQIVELQGGRFTGTFGAVANGFGADYAHETSESAYVGAVYAPSGGGGGGGSTPVTPVARVVSISGARGMLTVKLTCPAGGAGCSAATVTATITEHLKGRRITAVTAARTARTSVRTKVLTIARGTVVLGAGQTRTLTLALNATGRALLGKYGKLATLVRLSVAGRTVSTHVAHVSKPKKTKKK